MILNLVEKELFWERKEYGQLKIEVKRVDVKINLQP